jgi:hypothetical protein
MCTSRIPFAPASIRCVNGADLVESATVKDVDFAGEIAKSSECQESALWIEGDEVSGMSAKIVQDFNTLIEQDGLRWHISVDNTELLRVGAPREIMDRPFLIQLDPAVKIAGGTQNNKTRLAVITLVGFIDVRLSEHQYLSSQGVPFESDSVRFIEGLLARRCG